MKNEKTSNRVAKIAGEWKLNEPVILYEFKFQEPEPKRRPRKAKLADKNKKRK